MTVVGDSQVMNSISNTEHVEGCCSLSTGSKGRACEGKDRPGDGRVQGMIHTSLLHTPCGSHRDEQRETEGKTAIVKKYRNQLKNMKHATVG